MQRALLLLAAGLGLVATRSDLISITPVPKEQFDPRVSEFLRIDTNLDKQITFAEFILGDTEYIREQSKNFHRLDKDGDGFITKEEYDNYFSKNDGHRGSGDEFPHGHETLPTRRSIRSYSEYGEESNGGSLYHSVEHKGSVVEHKSGSYSYDSDDDNAINTNLIIPLPKAHGSNTMHVPLPLSPPIPLPPLPVPSWSSSSPNSSPRHHDFASFPREPVYRGKERFGDSKEPLILPRAEGRFDKGGPRFSEKTPGFSPPRPSSGEEEGERGGEGEREGEDSDLRRPHSEAPSPSDGNGDRKN